MIDALGHVGIYVEDLDTSVAFYRDIVGLKVTDDDREHGLVFLSANPQAEHHHLVLAVGRTAPRNVIWLQQISFRCHSLEDIQSYNRQFAEANVEIQYAITHGNAIGIYFFDPDGNRCEVYWPTGIPAKQAFRAEIDLARPGSEILAEVRRLVAERGPEGYVDLSLNRAHSESPGI